ncbi:MAG: TIGR00730 family Rossman fold protein [Candidatus Nitrospinota bacterium M3_3B_026]
MTIKSVCVYCASSRSVPGPKRELARRVGKGLARRGMRLVYGGASIGMMGEVADAALSEGGEVVGVIPEGLMAAEVAHAGLTELIVTKDMHSRKMAMFEMSGAFVSLPGGLGTLEETLEIITWKYLGIHIRPVIILNHGGFFDDLLAQFARCRREGVMREGLEGLWRVCGSVEEALEALAPGFSGKV